MRDKRSRLVVHPSPHPHFGGLWEAVVKPAENHLLPEIGHANITYEDMCTLLAQIEKCLYSRPLVLIPTDPADLEVLTPGHFLVGTSLQAVPDYNLCDIPDNRLTHFELTQKRFQRIWSRRYRGGYQGRQLATYPMAARKDHTKVHPGKDGVVRVVTLKTPTTEAVVHPVAKIAILPMPENNHLDSEE
ncbi:uncharacterized protein LOC134206343 [Armigeres subalbatus]|uniref:uncharacterized protein LOC134206343 n=1 Tax=Armigeres subalbatus TaxID=124917 RepID=UPI002ED0C13F